MNPTEFLAAFERHLQAHRVPFDRGHLLPWVQSAWPWIESDPSPEKWCGEYQAGATE
jgi:hypothetical protein